MIAFVTAWLIAGVLIGLVASFVDAWQLEGVAALWDAALAATSFTILLIMGRVWGPGLRASDDDPVGDWIIASLAYAPGQLLLGSILLSATLWSGWAMTQQ